MHSSHAPTTDNQPLPCHDKLAFQSLRDAEAAATTLAHRHGMRLKAYKCRHCPMWHLSSS